MLGDWQRILLGSAPWEFLVEVGLRTLIIYLALLITMRLLGKRMNAQLTVAELSVMIMLGGIVSVPMQIPERGLLHGVLILGCVLVLFRTINWLAYKYRRFEYFTQGDLQILVADGVLDLQQMAAAKLSREQLFANLRAANIQQLGQVKRAYLEANGEFSIYEQQPPRPGLSVLPGKDEAIHQAAPEDRHLKACGSCGQLVPAAAAAACPRCGRNKWTAPVNKM